MISSAIRYTRTYPLQASAITAILPKDPWLMIFKLFDNSSLKVCSLVSKEWHVFAKNSDLEQWNADYYFRKLSIDLPTCRKLFSAIDYEGCAKEYEPIFTIYFKFQDIENIVYRTERALILSNIKTSTAKSLNGELLSYNPYYYITYEQEHNHQLIIVKKSNPDKPIKFFLGQALNLPEDKLHDPDEIQKHTLLECLFFQRRMCYGNKRMGHRQVEYCERGPHLCAMY